MIHLPNDITIDTERFNISRAQQTIPVEPQVYDLIIYLIKNKHRVVTRQEIFDHIWQGRVVSDTALSNCVKSARKALGDDGSQQNLIKTVHGRGYQFIAETQQKSGSKTVESLLSAQYKTPLLTSIGLLLVCFVAFVLWQNRPASKSQQNTANLRSIAVLPLLNNKPSEATDYFGFAIADQIIGELIYFEDLNVRPSGSIRGYALTEYDPIAVGNQLGVDYILNGYYLKENQNVRLHVELIDVHSGNMVWRSESIESSFQNTFRLHDLVVEKVLTGLKLELSPLAYSRIQHDVSRDPLAYEYYLKSLAYPLTREGHQLSIAMLKQSISLDDQFAPAHVHLGNRLHRLAQYGLVSFNDNQQPEFHYLKALSINPDSLEALAHLSMLYTETNRIEKALELARHMHQLNPNNPNTHFTLGYIYRYAGLLKEAILEMETAVRLDPQNTRFRSIIGAYSGAGMYEKALTMTHNYPPSSFTYGWQALMHRRLGNRDKALELFDHVISLDPEGLWAQVATVHKAYMIDDKALGLKAINKLEQSQVTDGETIYYLAAYYGLLGDQENCIKKLQLAFEAGYFNDTIIANNDAFQSVQEEPEFKVLLERIKRKSKQFRSEFF